MPTSPSTFSTSLSLIRRAESKDADAWVRLAELYTPVVYGWARRAGLQPSDTADVVQEVFRTVARRIDVFRDEDGQASFRAWLWGITRNALKQHFREQAARPQATGGSDAQQRMAEVPDLLDQEDGPDPLDFRRRLLHRALRLIRNDFEEKTWQAFWRLTIDGHTAAEIGRDLGMHEKAVRQAKYRVLCRLRDEIADE